MINGNPALVLALLGTLLLAIVWGVIRRYGINWFGINGLRSAGHFMLIVACWGILQLAICAVIILLDTNTLIPFHPVKVSPPVQQTTGK